MKLEILCLFDTKARVYLQPVFCNHVDVGLRAIAKAANHPGHQLADFPSDFVIMHVATWDDTNAHFEQFREPIHLGLVAQFVSPKGEGNA